MTKEEAERAIAGLKPEWFCPLIRDLCNKYCVCYVPPKVCRSDDYYLEGSDDGYYVKKGYCNCPLLFQE